MNSLQNNLFLMPLLNAIGKPTVKIHLFVELQMKIPW